MTREGGEDISGQKTSSGLCSLLVTQAPKLKAFCVDCFLDRIAREVVGRSIVGCYCPGRSPGTVLTRKFVHVRVAGERAQPVPSLRFENVDAHGALISLSHGTQMQRV